MILVGSRPGENGEFTLAECPEGRLGICAYGGGWVSRDLANRSTLASFLTLDAPSSGSTLAHEVVPCARFQGKFVDPKGEGLWGAHLVAVPEGGDSLPWATITGIAKRTTETEKKGVWTIEGLIPGLTYDIQARSSDGDVRAARQCKAPTGPDEGSQSFFARFGGLRSVSSTQNRSLFPPSPFSRSMRRGRQCPADSECVVWTVA